MPAEVSSGAVSGHVGDDWGRLAHSFYNKLAVIMGECEILSDDAPDPKCRARIETILRAAQTMADELSGHGDRVRRAGS